MSEVDIYEDLPMSGNLFNESLSSQMSNISNKDETMDSTPLYNLKSTWQNNAIHF